MEKCMNVTEWYFLVQKMDESRNTILHQILSDRHPFSKCWKKRAGTEYGLDEAVKQVKQQVKKSIYISLLIGVDRIEGTTIELL